MYGLTAEELLGKDKFTLFLHRITHNVDTITITLADDTTWVVKARRLIHINYWIIGDSKEGVLSGELFDYLDELLFTDNEVRSSIVSIVTRSPHHIEECIYQYNDLYKELL